MLRRLTQLQKVAKNGPFCVWMVPNTENSLVRQIYSNIYYVKSLCKIRNIQYHAGYRMDFRWEDALI